MAWDYTAHVGMNYQWNHYFAGYQEAVNLLYEAVQNTATMPDKVAMPLLFCMRHSIELGYKFTLHHLGKMLGVRYQPSQDGHSLLDLHQKLELWFLAICGRNGCDDEVRRQFFRHLKTTEKIMKFFDRMDSDSFSFRYPTDKKEKIVF